VSPELSLILAYLKFPERQYSKKIFLELLKGCSVSSVPSLSYKGQQALATRKKLCLLFLSHGGSFGHKMFELFSSTPKVHHGDLGWSWRICSSVNIKR
jgi:hypothetical protein